MPPPLPAVALLVLMAATDASLAARAERRHAAGSRRKETPTPEGPRTRDGALRLPQIHRRRLENGLTVLLLPDRRLPIVALSLMVPRGAASDPDGRCGLTNFMVEMLRKGTLRRSAQDIARAVDAMGAALDTFADHDSSTVAVQSLREDAQEAALLLREIVREPAFPEAEVARLRAETASHLMHARDQPDFVADRAFDRAVFGVHPYARPAEGTVAAIQALTREDVVRQHGRLLTPRGSVLALVGDLRPHEGLALVRRALGDWTGNELPPRPPMPAEGPERPHVLLLDKPDATQAQIRVGHTSLPRRAEDYFPAALVNYALGGGGFSSRLMSEIRSKRGLTYGVSSHFSHRRDGGAFEISTSTRIPATRDALRACLAEALRMRQAGPTAKELAEAKDYFAGGFPLRLETPNAVAGTLLYAELHGLGDDYMQRYRARVRAVTREQAHASAAARLRPERVCVVVLGPASELADDLSAFGPLAVRAYDAEE